MSISEIIEEMLAFLEDDEGENAGFCKDDVRECKEILFDYIDALAEIENSADDEILAEVETTVISLGELNESTEGSLMEAVDKEIICEIIGDAATECGLKTDGEDITVYVRYQLKNIISLRSQYSVRLYPKLKDRPFGWTVSLEELRQILGATASSYDVFKDFNKHVLQKAIKEINEITDIDVTAEKIRKGRAVVSIKFTVKDKKQILLDRDQAVHHVAEEEEEEQISLPGVIEVEENWVESADPDDPLALCAGALPEGFTREQVQLLRNLAIEHLPFTVASMTEKELWLREYLYKKTLLMKASHDVHSPFAWLRQAVAEDWK
jgi:hypothetical protein